MKRLTVIAAALALIVLLVASPALLRAQPAEPIAGVSGGAIGQGESEVAPGYMLSLRRAVFEPGGYVSMHHHPGPLVLYVESGELTYGPIVEGETEVVRGEIHATGEGTVTPTEQLGPGDEVVLAAGDWLYEEGVVHGARNNGAEPAVVWLSALWAGDQPGTIFHEEATPAP